MFLIPLVLLFLTNPKLKALPKNIFLALLVGGVSLVGQYLAARYMGAESPAIIGSILSIIVIVLYGKLTASKEEKARKSTLKAKDILNFCPSFIRVNTDCILNIDYLSSVENNTLRCILYAPFSHLEISASRRHYSKIKEALNFL